MGSDGGEAATEEHSERRDRRKRARLLALEILRGGASPETAAKRLERDGFTTAEAARAVERADDRLQAEISAAERARCFRCAALLAKEAQFCEACGARAPDEAALSLHRSRIEPALVKGRKWLGLMSILYALGALVFGLIMESVEVFAVNLVLAAIQAGLWRWSKKQLLPAAVTSLVLFLTIHLLEAVVDPASLFRGIIVKVLFITALAQAIRAGLEARSLMAGARA